MLKEKMAFYTISLAFMVFLAIGSKCSGFKVEPRIIGGTEATKNEFPLMVALMMKMHFRQFCGGSIISSKHVLTAGHCMYEAEGRPLELESFGVVFGAHDMIKVKEGDIVTPIKATLYNKYKFEIIFDMCILEVPKIAFSSTVAPVCLPSTRFDFTGKVLQHMGWGLTKAGGFGARKLKKTQLHVVDREVCTSTYAGTNYFDNNEHYQVCTYQKGTSQCQGDSGGPVLYQNPSTKEFKLVGAISFGWPSCDKPSVISDISYFYPWIKKIVTGAGAQLVQCE